MNYSIIFSFIFSSLLAIRRSISVPVFLQEFISLWFRKVAVCTSHGCTMSDPRTAMTDAAGDFLFVCLFCYAKEKQPLKFVSKPVHMSIYD